MKYQLNFHNNFSENNGMKEKVLNPHHFIVCYFSSSSPLLFAESGEYSSFSDKSCSDCEVSPQCRLCLPSSLPVIVYTIRLVPPYWIKSVYPQPLQIIVLHLRVPVELVGTVTYMRTSTVVTSYWVNTQQLSFMPPKRARRTVAASTYVYIFSHFNGNVQTLKPILCSTHDDISS